MNKYQIANDIADKKHSELKNDDRVTSLNGDGSTKKAYQFNEGELQGKVIKVAKLSRAQDEIDQEIRTWMKYKDTEHRDLFCPIRNFDRNNHKWVIMDYADPATGGLSHLKSKIQEQKIKKALDDNAFDITPDNIGKHKDHGLVVFDYPWAKHLERYSENKRK